MAIDSHIKDAEGKNIANVISREGLNCLSVINQDYKRYLNKSVYLQSKIYGINMNQDFSAVESTENVHDGNDNTYWTATITTGQPSDFDFSSTDYAHTGTQSISCVEAEGGDEFQLENDTIILAGDYNRFVGWVYVVSDWNGSGDGLEIYLYNTNDNSQASDVVDLSNYINQQNINTWQKFNIPISDLGIVSEYNAIRCRMLAEGNPPNFYLDDLALESLTDDPAIFRVEPTRGRWWYVTGLGIIIVSSYDSTMADASMPNIPYNGLLGTSIVNGILYQRQEEGEIIFSFIIKDLIDIMNQHHTRISSYGYDGNYTWVKIDTDFETPFILKPEFGDYFSVNISDDLSNLKVLRMVTAVREEKRTVKGQYDNDQR